MCCFQMPLHCSTGLCFCHILFHWLQLWMFLCKTWATLRCAVILLLLKVCVFWCVAFKCLCIVVKAYCRWESAACSTLTAIKLMKPIIAKCSECLLALPACISISMQFTGCEFQCVPWIWFAATVLSPCLFRSCPSDVHERHGCLHVIRCAWETGLQFYGALFQCCA